MAVLRNSRREAGCGQRNTRFLVRNVFRRMRKKMLRAFFPFCFFNRRFCFFRPLFLFAVVEKQLLLLAVDFHSFLGTFSYSP